MSDLARRPGSVRSIADRRVMGSTRSRVEARSQSAILNAMKPGVLAPTAKELYDQDFFEWTLRNAELLRAGRLEEADLEHIAEEIEDIGKSERRELESRLAVLITHLLKWQAQPEHHSSLSGTATIKVQRLRLHRLLKQMPSLRRLLDEAVSEAYPEARVKAAAETRRPESSLPETCPFTAARILDPDFFPD